LLSRKEKVRFHFNRLATNLGHVGGGVPEVEKEAAGQADGDDRVVKWKEGKRHLRYEIRNEKKRNTCQEEHLFATKVKKGNRSESRIAGKSRKGTHTLREDNKRQSPDLVWGKRQKIRLKSPRAKTRTSPRSLLGKRTVGFYVLQKRRRGGDARGSSCS